MQAHGCAGGDEGRTPTFQLDCGAGREGGVLHARACTHLGGSSWYIGGRWERLVQMAGRPERHQMQLGCLAWQGQEEAGLLDNARFAFGGANSSAASAQQVSKGVRSAS